MGDPVPWQQAWQEALYGVHGFYRGALGPAGHFTTATHGALGTVLAEALWAWADRLGCSGIVDVGAGRGELLGHLLVARPGAALSGVEVVRRPAGLPAEVGWVVSPGGAALPSSLGPAGSLVVAHEWLDVVPCVVAAVDHGEALREVLVDAATGEESLGGSLGDTDLAWCAAHWPLEPGERVEVGRTRDAAWSALLDRLDGGAAIAVDYGHRRADRPINGTLAGYRDGALVDPVPDGSCDLTAHVAVDTLGHDRLLTQREALGEVGVTGALPDHALASRDPAAYAAALSRASAAAALRDPAGFGSFWWVVATGQGPGSR